MLRLLKVRISDLQALRGIGGQAVFKTFDEAEEKAKGKGEVKKDAWRRWGIAKLELDLAVEDYILKAGLDTIGALSDFMGKHGDFWDKDLPVGGESKPRNLLGESGRRLRSVLAATSRILLLSSEGTEATEDRTRLGTEAGAAGRRPCC